MEPLDSSSTSSTVDSDVSLQNPPPIQRIVHMFQRPSRNLDYLNSQQLAQHLYKITVRELWSVGSWQSSL